MRNRLGYAIVVTLLGTSAFLSACNDDEDDPGDTNGGENAGGDPSTGGSSAGRAGSTGGGRAGAGGSAGSSMGGNMTDAGAGGMSDAGAGGDDGMGGAAAGMGGAAAGMGGANVGGAEGGAAGAGGAENPVVTYACTANSINHKLCSAFAAAECDTVEPCPDCVTRVQEDRSFFEECSTCLAEFDKYYQCAIDGFEAGDVSAGVQCFAGAAEPAEACFPHLDEAFACQDYIAVEDCPATWPPTVD